MDKEKVNPPSMDSALTKTRREVQQLEKSLHRQSSDLEKARKRIERLERENSKLKEELKLLRGKPSWAKPNKPEEAKRRAKKLGPKKGHPCSPRKLPDKIDREVNVVPKQCPHCGTDDLPAPHKWHQHVQIDLPPPQSSVVTRYHVGWCWCRYCNKAVSGGTKLSRSLYGPHLHARVSYWKYSLGLTLPKMQALLKEQYELDLSTGQLSALLKRSATCFDGMYEDIATTLLDQPGLYADETGWRMNGDNRWLWSFSSEEYSYYTIEASRGSKVVKKVLGEAYGGTLVSDFYAGYNKLNSSKQKCWSHALRKCAELCDKYPNGSEVRYYASRLKKFYQWSVRLQQLYEEGHDIDCQYKRLSTSTEHFLFRQWKHPALKTLSKRLIKYRGELYTFIMSGVEPTNNRAEREIRPAVLMRKTSYGNRSEQGAESQAVLMSIIRTCHKQNLNFSAFAADHMMNHWNLGE
jgi:transposase